MRGARLSLPSFKSLCSKCCSLRATPRGVFGAAYHLRPVASMPAQLRTLASGAAKPMVANQSSCVSGLGRNASHSSLSSAATTQVAARDYTSSAATTSYDWRRLRGFLFDIDGTLTDTDPLHIVAFR